MYKLNELKKMSVTKLKEIADDKKIKYSQKTNKDDLIKLLSNKPKEKKKKISIDDISELPQVYGKNKMVLMIKDPYNGFVYWDMDEDMIKKNNLNDKPHNDK